MERDINYTERRDALLIRRELSRAKRIESRKHRLHVSLGGFKSYFEDI